MIITDTGIIIRLDVEKISQMSRVTQGVRLINLKGEQKVSSISIVDKTNEEEQELDNPVDNSEIIEESGEDASE